MLMTGWLRTLTSGFGKRKNSSTKRPRSSRLGQSVAASVHVASEVLESRTLLAGFTPGNIIVSRIDGTSVNAQTVTLFEYTTSGTLVQSFTLTSTGANALTQSGANVGEGQLSLATNGTFLTLVGYNANAGTSAISDTTSAVVNRVVGTVDVFGDHNIVSRLSNRYSTVNINGAVSDGTSFWTSGFGLIAGQGGIQYISAAGVNSGTQIGTNLDIRSVAIGGGQLYAVSDTQTPNPNLTLGNVGVGLPTSLATTITSAVGFPPATAVDFQSVYFADLSNSVAGTDTAYVANVTGISKYTFNGSSWTFNGFYGGPGSDYRNLTGSVSGSNVTLFATRNNATGQLARIVDSTGYNGNFTTGLTDTTLATFAAGSQVRGVSFAPSQVIGTSGDDTFILTANGGSWTLTWGTKSTTFVASALANLRIDGAGGNDRIIIRGGSGNDTFTLNGNSVTVAGTGTVNLSQFQVETYDIDGADGNDTINIETNSALVGSFLGGNGDDTFNITTAVLPGTINGGANTDTIIFNGTALVDTVTQTAAQITIANANATTNYSLATYVAEVYVVNTLAEADVFNLQAAAANNQYIAGSGNDVFNLSDGVSASVIDGGDDVDTLNYGAYTTGISVNLSSLRDYGTISATNIGTLTATAGNANVENVTGGSGNDTLLGSDVNNILIGGDGNDTFAARGGDDTLDGGIGDDLYQFRSYADLGLQTKTVVENSGIDTLDFSGVTDGLTVDLTTAGLRTVAAGEMAVSFDGLAFERVTGGSGSDTITGNGLDNVINGGAGNDTITGGAGDDTLNGGADQDTYVFLANSALGSDSITDASGIDTITFAGTTSAITIDLSSTALQAINGSLNLTLASGSAIERVTGGNGNDTFTGNSQANLFSGGLGNDTYLFNTSSNLGSDTVTDGSGIDTIDFTGSSLGATLDLSQVTVQSVNANLSLTVTVANSIENVIGTAQNDVFTGNAANNTLTGGAGNDTYRFNASTAQGTDAIVDSRGIDSLDYTGTNVAVTVNLASAGVQTINANQFLTLPGASDIENVTGGSAGDTLIGNSLSNTLTGGDGDDTYAFVADSSLGSDTIVDSSGTDLVTFAGTISAVALNLGTTSAQAVNANLTLTLASATSIENVTGGVDADTLSGNSLNNTLAGGGGNDTYLFNGDVFGGTDTIVDSAGTDAVSFAGTAAAVSIDLGNAASQVVNGNLSLILSNATSIENAVGGNGGDTLIGSSIDNILDGGAGNDTYLFNTSTGLGTDTLADSAGTDTLSFAGSSIGIVIDLSQAAVQVVNGNLSVVLGSSTAFENVIGSSSSDTIAGNSVNNTLDGGLGDDTYSFAAGTSQGTDTLLDAGGVDTLDFNTSSIGVTINLGSAGSQTVTGNLSLILGDATRFENVTGSAFTDTIFGNSLNNTLAGGAGNDTYRFNGDVAGGTDTLNDSSGIDLISFAGTTSAVTFNLGLTSTQAATANQSLILVSATAFENLAGGTGNDTLTGNSINNTLIGDSGNDNLAGGAGNDTLQGNAGDDTYTFVVPVGAEADTISNETSGRDLLTFATVGTLAVTVNLSLAAGPQTVINSGGNSLSLTFDGAVFENVTGGNGADTLTGNGLANVLTGNQGADTLIGGLGADTLVGGLGSDSLIGGDGDDTYSFGGPLGAELDTISGETSGSDVLNFAAVGTNNVTVNLSLAAGSQTVLVNGANSLSINLDGSLIERITGGSGNDTFTGNALANTITGGSGNDSIFGLGGADNLFGGTGDDIVNGGTENDVLYGEAGSDTISGGDGDDTYVMSTPVGTENDSITGETLGSDLIQFGAAISLAATLNLSAAAGVQVVINSGANILNLNLDGSVIERIAGGNGNDTLTGNGLNNIIMGGNGNDTLLGMGGNDTLQGDAGADTVDGGEGNDLLTGGTGSDTFTGGNGDDTYVFVNPSGTETESIVGETAGTDTLSFASIGNLAVNVNLSLAAGNQTVINAGGFVLNLNFDGAQFERANGGAGNDTITGNTLNNVINGGAGNDLLVGGFGNDSLSGNAGNDTLNGGDGDDTYGFGSPVGIETDSIVNETSGADTVSFGTLPIGVGATLDISLAAGSQTAIVNGLNSLSITLDGALIERLTGGAGDDNLTGNGLNNTLIGNAGNDILNGGGGNDVLLGYAGNDTLIGGLGDDNYTFFTPVGAEADIISGETGGTDIIVFATTIVQDVTIQLNLAAGVQNVITGGNSLSIDFDGSVIDRVTGGAGNDVIIGNNLVNVLTGGDGDDIIVGLGGNDTLTGGNGRDILIGGDGGDVLNGSLGGDILIGGSTTIDTNVASLVAVRTAWTAVDTYANRLAAAAAIIGAITDNNTFDRATGGVEAGEPNLDAYFLNLADVLTDLEVGETRTTV